jgi:hypothetical protein
VRRTTVLTTITIAAAALTVPLLTAAEASPAKIDEGRAHLMYRFKDTRIVESSGIETSTRFRNITYTHNDSGDEARFFAIGKNGGTRAVFTLPGATHYDWEDMSAGPRNTLWFGDIGSNAAKRGEISVYRVKEPRRLKSRALSYTRFRFKYRDGQAHNAETLMVNPRTGALMIVTKSLSGAAFFRAQPPFKKSGVTTLRKVGLAPSGGKITAGSYSPNGRRFVIRNYVQAFYYKSVSVKTKPYELRIPSGGESLAYARHKGGIIIGNEGVHSAVYRITRR